MAKDFKVKNGVDIQTTLAAIDSATEIEAGDLVELTSGLITKADDSSAAVAYCPNGSAEGEVLTEVSVGNDFTLLGTADENFAATDRGAEVDLVVSNSTQYIDLGSSSTDVLKVGISSDSGTVGAEEEVEVRINKPLF